MAVLVLWCPPGWCCGDLYVVPKEEVGTWRCPNSGVALGASRAARWRRDTRLFPEHLHNAYGVQVVGLLGNEAAATRKVQLFQEACRPPVECKLVRAAETFQPKVICDLFGDPKGLAARDSAWLIWNNGAVPKLARAIYDDRAFDRLPILADALEEAGCDDADILAHCRSGGEHFRGCWVLDLILSKDRSSDGL